MIIHRMHIKFLILCSALLFNLAHANACQDNHEEFLDKLASYPSLLSLHDIATNQLASLRKNKTIVAQANKLHCDWLKKRDQWLEKNGFDDDASGWSKRCVSLKPLYTFYVQRLNQQHALLKKINKEPHTEYPSFIEQNSNQSLSLIQEQWSHHVKELEQDSFKFQIIENEYSTLDPTCGGTHFKFFVLKDNQYNKVIDSLLTPELLKIKHQPKEVKPYSQYLYKQGFYDYRFSEEFVAQSPKYVSLKHQFYEFTGGAHGNHALFLFTLDLAKGTKLTLENLISPDNKDWFLEKALHAFIQDNNLKENQSLQSQGFWFEPTRENGQERWRLNDDFYVPENFFVNEEGLHFVYQTYEIAPYSYGHPSFSINWSDLEPMLTETWKCLPECKA